MLDSRRSRSSSSTNIKVLEGGLRPLARLKQLRALVVSNQFETADYAYLSVALPNVECDHFAPYIDLGGKIGDKDTMVVGLRKGFLDSKRDAVRLAKHIADFERLRATFRAELTSRSHAAAHDIARR